MRRALVVLFGLILSPLAQAADVYVVQGYAFGPLIDPTTAVLWSSNTIFYNTGSRDATISLLSVSNGGRAVSSGVATLGPQRSSSPDGLSVSPGSGPLWVSHFDAPSDVLVDAALFIGWTSFVGPSPGSFPYAYGKLRLPVFRSLVPAGQKQIHLLTSLGPASNIPVQVQVPSRINVAIYNSASVPANAVIEIRQHCDDQIVTTRAVTIAPDTIVQIGPFDARTSSCGDSGFGQLGLFVDTTVTVDQPSFSFVSNLSNAATPTTSISITAAP
jgi:hypothetical protein